MMIMRRMLIAHSHFGKISNSFWQNFFARGAGTPKICKKIPSKKIAKGDGDTPSNLPKTGIFGSRILFFALLIYF